MSELAKREKICAFDMGVRFFTKEAGMNAVQSEVFHKIARWYANGDVATVPQLVKKAAEEGLNIQAVEEALLNVMDQCG